MPRRASWTGNHSLSYDVLKRIAKQLTVVAAILNRRINQVAAMAAPFRITKSLGYEIKHKDPERQTTAEWERRAITARVRAGIDAARRRGTHLGRPERAVDTVRATKLMTTGLGLRATARELGLSHRTLGRALERVPRKPRPARGLQVRGKTRHHSG